MNQVQPAKTAAAQAIAKKHASPFITDAYRAALDRLDRAFTARRPLAILVGEDDAGASFINRGFLDGIEGDVAVAHITEPCEDAFGGIRKIVHALGFDSNNMKLADLEDVVGMFLSLQKMHDRRTIICIEQTEDNGRWVVDEIYRLVELEMEGKFGLMLILSGQPALNELLGSPPLSAIPENAGPRIALARFTLAETKEYIRWRIESGSHAHFGPVFENNAIALMHELTAGVPDTVRNLCNKCLQLAARENTSPVTAKIVMDAVKLPAVTHTMQSQGVRAASGRLIVRVNGQFVREQALNRGKLLIGRDGQCDIQLMNSMVSRRHANVVISSNGVALTDLGSRNGTYANGRRIEQYVLQDNDTIEIGQCSLKYVAGDNGPA